MFRAFSFVDPVPDYSLSTNMGSFWSSKTDTDTDEGYKNKKRKMASEEKGIMKAKEYQVVYTDSPINVEDLPPHLRSMFVFKRTRYVLTCAPVHTQLPVCPEMSMNKIFCVGKIFVTKILRFTQTSKNCNYGVWV